MLFGSADYAQAQFVVLLLRPPPEVFFGRGRGIKFMSNYEFMSKINYRQMTRRWLKDELTLRRKLEVVGGYSSLWWYTKRDLIARLEADDAARDNGKVADAIMKTKMQTAAASAVVDFDPDDAKWSRSKSSWEWSRWEWSGWNSSSWRDWQEWSSDSSPAPTASTPPAPKASTPSQIRSRTDTVPSSRQRRYSWSQERRRLKAEDVCFRDYNTKNVMEPEAHVHAHTHPHTHTLW